jgi:hypothetical protein
LDPIVGIVTLLEIRHHVVPGNISGNPTNVKLHNKRVYDNKYML